MVIQHTLILVYRERRDKMVHLLALQKLNMQQVLLILNQVIVVLHMIQFPQWLKVHGCGQELHIAVELNYILKVNKVFLVRMVQMEQTD